MIRRISIILVLLLLVSLLGCTAGQEEKFQDPINLYFLRVQTETMNHGSETSVFMPLVREGHGIRSNLLLLLNRYLADPGTEEFRSAFPENVSVISVRNDGDLLEITLTDNFAELSGLDLTLACACLTYTVMDLIDTQGVRICAETKPLDGHASITMNNHNLLLTDAAITPTKSGE